MTEFTEKYLAKTAAKLGLNTEQMPKNIAIIMDGNGRWAQKKGLPRIEGHRQGGKVVERIALDCVDIGVESLTLYAFSTENWKRPAEEIEGLMKLYTQYLIGIRPMMMKNQVKLVHIGSRENIPSHVTDALDESMEMTRNNVGMILGLALNYSGRNEIVDAAKKIAAKIKDSALSIEDIDEKCISSHLYTPQIKDPDLLMRTSDEMRISNFLLWQIAYCEFYVTPVCWPDFNRKELEKAILEYSKRNRRFGGLSNKS